MHLAVYERDLDVEHRVAGHDARLERLAGAVLDGGYVFLGDGAAHDLILEDEARAAFERFDAYCGTWEIDAATGNIIHHVDGSRFPNWTGTDQVRMVELAGDRLVLRTPPILAAGQEWTGELVWQRLG